MKDQVWTSAFLRNFRATIPKNLVEKDFLKTDLQVSVLETLSTFPTQLKKSSLLLRMGLHANLQSGLKKLRHLRLI